ncbi:hypothetical protein RhiirB3_460640 [Rhizophagus irregularis]|nr:hypothetical protein RhiirB3_460640 [Rhizophagus irregularis]
MVVMDINVHLTMVIIWTLMSAGSLLVGCINIVTAKFKIYGTLEKFDCRVVGQQVII